MQLNVNHNLKKLHSVITSYRKHSLSVAWEEVICFMCDRTRALNVCSSLRSQNLPMLSENAQSQLLILLDCQFLPRILYRELPRAETICFVLTEFCFVFCNQQGCTHSFTSHKVSWTRIIYLNLYMKRIIFQ